MASTRAITISLKACQIPVNPDHLTCLKHLSTHLAASRDGITGLCLIGLEAIAQADSLFGYRAGDAVCAQVAASLTAALRPADRIFRVGRGELAVLLPNLTTAAQPVLAAHKIVRTLGSQLEIAPYTLYCVPRVGVACAPDHAGEADTLLQRAASALREARLRGEPVVVYEPAGDAAYHNTLSLQRDLKSAIEHGELRLAHQPQIDLATGAVVGIEALARWHSPRHASLPPARFIAVAEQAGLMQALSNHVLNAALREARALADAGFELNVSINLSAQDLAEPTLPEWVAQALGTWGVAASRLVLEMTETAVMGAVMGEVSARRATLEGLRALGVRLSIDDFGTGHSSLARLKNVPADELKIDRQFVRHMLQHPRDETIVRAVIALGHSLDLQVVAEGAEDMATLARLRALGCDSVQGYALSPPRPLADLLEWLRARPQSGHQSFTIA